jgi:hypothetical protein
MTPIEDQIAELLAQAEPLRALPDLEAEKQGLPALVDRINALRAVQALDALAPPKERMGNGGSAWDIVEGPAPVVLAEVDAPIEAPARKKPGRKPKVAE